MTSARQDRVPRHIAYAGSVHDDAEVDAVLEVLRGGPSALRIGLAFDCQVLDHVPREPHDVALHFIVTEVATYTVA